MRPPRKRLDWNNSTRPSKITIPDRANPLAKLVFAEMQRQRVTYAELEHRSGIIISTIKSWRNEKAPSLCSIQAALGALGWTLVPVPCRNVVPDDIDEHLEALVADELAFAAALQATAALPQFCTNEALARNNHKNNAPPSGAVS